ncbi:MAG: aminotransferase class I/II-fold pyridoxal phosphate-dependent enzyme [Candidatus Binatia bacterium]
MSRLFASAARARERRAGRTAERLRGLTLSPIKDVELQASRLPGVVSLAQGIPSFDTPEPIKRFAAERMAEGACARYSVSPGLPALREAIAESLAGDGMAYDPDREILVTVGSIEAIAATLLAHVDEGDEVLVVSPTYASYLPAIRLAGGVPRWVPLDEDAHFDLDPDAIAAAVSRRTRALLLCNPNNPTGTVFSREQTLRMLRVAAEHDLLVITDEVYKDFVYGEAGIFSAAMEPAARERVIRVCSFSKAYGMTGWRVGFLHGPAERVTDILTVHDALVTCAPVVSQYAALAALEQGDAFIAEFAAEFRRRRDHVVERLDALSHVFDYQKPNASYFAFPRVKDTVPFARDSRRLAADLLQQARVALVPGWRFGPARRTCASASHARRPTSTSPSTGSPSTSAAARRGAARLPAAVGEAAAGAARCARRPSACCATSPAPACSGPTRASWRSPARRARRCSSARSPSCWHGGCVHANPLSYNTAVGLPLAVLDAELDTRRPLAAAATFARAAWHAYGPVAPLDAMVLELGVRRAGDMRRHLEIVRPDVVVVTPLAASYRDDLDALDTLRAEIALLCRDAAERGAAVLLCADDPTLAALAAELPGAATYSASELERRDGGLVLRADDGTLPVGRDVVGASGQRALAAAVHVARRLGLSPADIAAYLAS